MLDTKIFKAYDIRGIYPEQIDEQGAYAIGQGYAQIVKPKKPVVIGRDVRLYSKSLQKEIIRGLNDAGVDTIDIGLISTEMCYFAVGYYGYGGGIQVTASHNPKEWHGAKMVMEHVVPISTDNGINEIRDFACSNQFIHNKIRGVNIEKNVIDDFCQFILNFVNYKSFKPMKLVYNPNFGYEGEVLKHLVKKGSLPLELIPLNDQPNGEFPKGRPDPFITENRLEFIDLVKQSNVDFGVTWDADADRVFFCAGDGTFVDPYYLNSLLIKHILKAHPGGKIIYDPRYTWSLLDAINQSGGEPILCRVGHSFIKAKMREVGAIMAGESSGHTYYKDFWFADSGLIPLLQVLELLSKEGKSLKELTKPLLNKYFISGEINTEVANKDGKMKELAFKYSDANISWFDGVSIEYSDWRANIRQSNTENLLRLNLEARSYELMESKRDEMLALIRN